MTFPSQKNLIIFIIYRTHLFSTMIANEFYLKDRQNNRTFQPFISLFHALLCLNTIYPYVEVKNVCSEQFIEFSGAQEAD